MKVIGLTGSLGAGKSTVARMFGVLGASVIDADQVARAVVAPRLPAWEDIIEEFGEEVLNCDSTLNRKKLAEIVFADPEKRERLNSITHPRIIEEITNMVERHRAEGTEVLLIEAALIAEKGGMGGLISALIVVTADEESQINRVMIDRRLSREEALLRLRAQMSGEEKAARATYVIDNSGSLQDTARQVQELWEELSG
ncbi:MAG: dephospho-CoA kinase [Candidatus Dadabacteria bacterium]|nr:dephospho-CoA kinase [Candidatus Dadabacteria bacterium]